VTGLWERLASVDQGQLTAYVASDIPSQLDHDLRETMAELALVPDHGELWIDHGLSDVSIGVLQVFAQRMAELAVRERDASLLFVGLLALVAGGLEPAPDVDRRYALTRMALIYGSALTLRVDPRDLFDRAGRVAGPHGRNLLSSFPDRPGGANMPWAFGFRGEQGPAGFRYVEAPMTDLLKENAQP